MFFRFVTLIFSLSFLFCVGLRPSARYIYDQDWIKLGQLPRFSFVEPDENEDEIVQNILATNNLVGDLHNIRAVLHGLEQQIKINL